MTDIDITALADLLRESARTEILPRFRNLDADGIRAKTDGLDLVTEADEAAERRIGRRIAEIMPKALFVGEEGVAANPGLLSELAGADLAVVVDPIDGTFNFAVGLPLFGVMLSVVSKGETVAGLIYDPMGDDWAATEKGSGAWLCKPDGSRRKMSVASAPPNICDMIGAASLGYFDIETRKRLLAGLAGMRMFSGYRCAAHEYRLLCQGHTHFVMYNKLMPWDHLAGALMAQEAGGYVARLDGSPYRPAHTGGGLLIAPDSESWKRLREEVFTV